MFKKETRRQLILMVQRSDYQKFYNFPGGWNVKYVFIVKLHLLLKSYNKSVLACSFKNTSCLCIQFFCAPFVLQSFCKLFSFHLFGINVYRLLYCKRGNTICPSLSNNTLQLNIFQLIVLLQEQYGETTCSSTTTTKQIL